MNCKTLTTLSCLALAAGAACAQTGSVQIAGQLGVGAARLNNQVGGSLHVLNDNLVSASWLRFTGTEDLGGGLNALFRLESAVGLDTGTAGTTKFWNRQAWVGLRQGPVAVTLGRQFHAATDRAIRTLDVNNLQGSSAHVTPLALFGVNRFSANDNRVDNAVKVRLTLPGVLEAGASVGAGEGTLGRSYSADIAHGGKGYELGALLVHYNALAAVGSHVPEHMLVGFGGNVRLGPVRPYLAYFSSKLDATVAGRLQQKNKILHAGMDWSLTSEAMLRLAYYDDKGTALNGINGRDGKKTTLAAIGSYALSKRTELYAAAFQNRFTGGYKQEAVNLAALNRNPADSSVTGLSVGMKHQF